MDDFLLSKLIKSYNDVEFELFGILMLSKLFISNLNFFFMNFYFNRHILYKILYKVSLYIVLFK